MVLILVSARSSSNAACLLKSALRLLLALLAGVCVQSPLLLDGQVAWTDDHSLKTVELRLLGRLDQRRGKDYVGCPCSLKLCYQCPVGRCTGSRFFFTG